MLLLFQFRSARESRICCRKNRKVLSIEVKSRKVYKSQAALDNVLKIDEWKLSEATVLCSGNIEQVKKPISFLVYGDVY